MLHCDIINKEDEDMIHEGMAKSSAWCYPVMESAHTLIAGTTGSGKSVCLNALLYNIYRQYGSTPDGFGLYLIDPKRVELKAYKNSKAVIGYETEPDRISDLLDFVLEDMDGVYARMEGKKSTEGPTFIVVDELADLVSDQKILNKIVKIGRLGRAADFHLICCTQDPSRTTLSAAFMQNMTCCIALKCKSETESKQIVGKAGAEDLPVGYGWMECGSTYGSFKIDMVPDEDIKEYVRCIDLFWNYEHYVQRRMEEKWTLLEKIRGQKKLLDPPMWMDPNYAHKLMHHSAKWVEI